MVKSYYDKLREFRETDIRYIGSGGYNIARKEFGLGVNQRLSQKKYNIPDKDRIYLEYTDERYRREKINELRSKERRKQQEKQKPEEYKKYKDAILRVKYTYTNKGLDIKNIPKVWPERIIKQIEELRQKRKGKTEELPKEKEDEIMKEIIERTRERLKKKGEELEFVQPEEIKKLTIDDFKFKNEVNKPKAKPIKDSEINLYKLENLGALDKIYYLLLNEDEPHYLKSVPPKGNSYAIYSKGSTSPVKISIKSGSGQYVNNFYYILKFLNDHNAVIVDRNTYLKK